MCHSLASDLSMWALQAPVLARRFRVVRFDTRGHGGSDAPAGPYTLDLLADLTGRVVSVVPRQRLRVVSGESVVGRTVEAPVLVDRAVALSTSLGLVGHNTLQCFFEDAEPLWIEVNPRFGGGAALGFAAGVDTPRLLVEWLQGAPVVPRLGQYERGLTMYRYSTDLYVRGEA
jgi:carbamoyl-phosphate synthase large subunit